MQKLVHFFCCFSGINAAYVSIEHAGSMFLFKFQDLGNDTAYLTHILHFFEWRLSFCFVFLPVDLALPTDIRGGSQQQEQRQLAYTY